MLPMPTSFNCTVFLADKQRPRDRRNHSYGNMRDPGKLILLNGTLCSGTTAIAIALQSLLAEPYLTVRIEHFCLNRLLAATLTLLRYWTYNRLPICTILSLR